MDPEADGEESIFQEVTSVRRGRGRPYGVQPPRTVVPSLLDIAWAAGLYEGEGSVTTTSTVNTKVALSQKDDEVLLRLASFFGGKIYPGKNTNGEPRFTWMLSRERAWGFLLTVFTFLSSRRRKQIRDVFAVEAICRGEKKFDTPEDLLVAQSVLRESRDRTTSKGRKPAGPKEVIKHDTFHVPRDFEDDLLALIGPVGDEERAYQTKDLAAANDFIWAAHQHGFISRQEGLIVFLRSSEYV